MPDHVPDNSVADFSPSLMSVALPWVVGAVALGLLIIQVQRDAHTIEASVIQRAMAVVAVANIQDVEADVDGRDVSVRGTVPASTDLDNLIARLGKVTGVRSVSDQVERFDATQQRLLQQRAFQGALANIDLDAVAFEAGSTTFAEGSEAALTAIASLLEEYPDMRVRIGGHTDNTGRDSVNVRISQQRATAVARYLGNQAIDSSRLIVKGYGATQPVVSNETEAGRTRNRRIEITYVD